MIYPRSKFYYEINDEQLSPENYWQTREEKRDRYRLWSFGAELTLKETPLYLRSINNPTLWYVSSFEWLCTDVSRDI